MGKVKVSKGKPNDLASAVYYTKRELILSGKSMLLGHRQPNYSIFDCKQW